MSWEEIFAQTDRDINLQRVMNVVRFGDKTRTCDWIPDRAIGPTDDALYELEGDYNDGEVAGILGVSGEEVAAMATSRKRVVLMDYRKQELQRLIDVYYAERGWNRAGIPFIDTLQELGLWGYLTAETQEKIAGLQEIVAPA
ncbi:aldehyde ferredoxin oxidoreductase C-terminal domain-containing protein [Geotalea toluenoxydans]|uniref:aldehyde ferredoxin oxidoreductase C-terminal domain-containing protein n=1 Tax=Geotalea toluenoxydans TaxID=421624 RepID=UPI0024369CEE|nr:aldehyde ferredoxin oxidoreductase C-terminal domain-containing protein [Geotalea toluenoxydans]